MPWNSDTCFQSLGEVSYFSEHCFSIAASLEQAWGMVESSTCEGVVTVSVPNVGDVVGIGAVAQRLLLSTNNTTTKSPECIPWQR